MADKVTDKGRQLITAIRAGAALGLLAAAFLVSGGAAAQQQNARCYLLEQELQSYEQAWTGGNPEADRLNEAIGRQQEALSRTEAHARQIGCYKTGFLFFRPQRPPECRQLKASISEMERNLAQLTARRDQTSGPFMGNNPGKQRILRLLAENRCGPQYERFATYNRTPSIFGGWFEEDSGPGDSSVGTMFGRRMLGTEPTYRTLCVRSCDGYYFPISFATLPERFETDAQACRALCPSAVVELYVHENPGGSPEQMVSLSGRPYSSIPTAFQYRKEYVKGCSCNPYTLKLEEEEEKRAEAATQPVTAPQGGQAPEGGQAQEGGQAPQGAKPPEGGTAPAQGQQEGNAEGGGSAPPASAEQSAEGARLQGTAPEAAGESEAQDAAEAEKAEAEAEGGPPIVEIPGSEEAAAQPETPPAENSPAANAPAAPGSGQVNIYRGEPYSDRFQPRFSTGSSQGANIIRIRPAGREDEPRFSTSPTGGTRLPYPDPGQGR